VPPALPEYAITVTAAAITIERLGSPTPQKYIYNLDGSESVNTVGTMTTRTKSRWAGDSLVSEGTRAIPTSQGTVTTTVKEVRSLDKDDSVVVKQTRQIAGQPATRAYQVFVKKPKT
jgi:hypothetical protein